MPIMPNPDKPNQSAPTQEIRDQTNQTAVIDTRKTPLASLMAYLEGHSWTVQYYNQVLGVNDDPAPISLSVDATLQQYHHIQNLEFKVSEPLSYTYVGDSVTDLLRGSGVTYPNGVTPNPHDVFLAEIGDGRIGIFTIDNVTPMMMMLERCYRIEYKLLSLSIAQYESNLTEKTVKTSYFVRDMLMSNKYPIMSSEDVGIKINVENHAARLMEMFIDEFVSRSHRFLLVPDQEQTTYDHFVSNVLKSITSMSEYNRLRDANWPNLGSIREMNVVTFWDCLIKSVPLNGRSVCKKMQIVDTWVFKNTPIFTNIYYTPVKRVVYPLDNPMDVDDAYINRPTVISYPLAVGSARVDAVPAPAQDPDVPAPPDDIYLVTKDDYYVLSEAFYTGNREAQSRLELMVTRMLNHEVIDSDDVRYLCDRAYSWGSVERYYYIPILLIAINYLMRKM